MRRAASAPNRSQQLRAVLVVFVVLVGGIAMFAGSGVAEPATAGQHNAPSPTAQAQQAQPNATATVQLSETPNGLQKYNITISVSETPDTDISGIEPGEISGNEFQIVSQPPDDQSITFRAVDLTESVGRNEGTISLATLNLTNRSVTAGDLDITVHTLVDDDGNEISPTRIDLTVEASQPSGPFPNGVPGVASAPPTDPDGDGQFEDVNGDGTANFSDAIDLAFADTGAINSGTQAEIDALDFDGDGDVDFDDAIERAFE